MSNSVRPHRRQLTRLPCPWDSPGKNTGAGCHFLLQCMKVKSESEVTQSCPTLHNPMDCSLPGSSVHGIFQARVLERGAIAFSVQRPYLTSVSKSFHILVFSTSSKTAEIKAHSSSKDNFLCRLSPKSASVNYPFLSVFQSLLCSTASSQLHLTVILNMFNLLSNFKKKKKKKKLCGEKKNMSPSIQCFHPIQYYRIYFLLLYSHTYKRR